MLQLKEIYQPVEKELQEVESSLRKTLQGSRHQSIQEASNYLLSGKGKRLRPALVLLSARASRGAGIFPEHELTRVATAVELIHMASLIHDDVIDHAQLRHNQPTVNAKWGADVSIALGDYLYALAFDAISALGNIDVLQCLSSAAQAMCEGELLQVCERDNLDLLKERYLLIVKKKTASLFAASCRAGGLIAKPSQELSRALGDYGLNFGIAFQMTDDYLDLMGQEQDLGKAPGQDMGVGEITLPLLNLLDTLPLKKKEELKSLLRRARKDKQSLQAIKSSILDSNASQKTEETISLYIALAKKEATSLPASPYRESLLNLADFILARGFGNLTQAETNSE